MSHDARDAGFMRSAARMIRGFWDDDSTFKNNSPRSQARMHVPELAISDMSTRAGLSCVTAWVCGHVQKPEAAMFQAARGPGARPKALK